MKIFRNIKNKFEIFTAKKYSQFYTTVKIKVIDRDGFVLSERTQLGKSLVGNFLAFKYASDMAFVDVVAGFSKTAPFTKVDQVVQINGTLLNLGLTTSNITALAGDSSYGLVIGTGIAVPTAFDIALASQITNGNGAGQMLYQSQYSPGGVVIDGANTSLTYGRTFLNSSGAPITVHEIGIYHVGVAVWMSYRDIIPGGELVNDAQLFAFEVTHNTVT
jgi:hypothetical protein